MNFKFTHIKDVIFTKKIIIFSIISILTLFLFYCLVLNPALGMADNGDFGRMFIMSGLTDAGSTYSEEFDGYFHKFYILSNPGFLLPWYPSVVVGCYISKIALIIGLKFHLLDSGFFDIRALGIIYSGIFIFGIYLILKYDKLSNIARLVCGILAILVFTDGIYIAYFNSFFGEAATISFMFLTIGSFLNLISKDEPLKGDFILFFIASSCLLTSKTQQLPLLLFMLIIYFALYKFYGNYKKLIIKSTVIVTILCTIMFISIGDFTNKNNLYQSVFTGILYDSETPEEDLKELGIDTKFAVLAGTGFYGKDLSFDPMGSEMLSEFYPNISIGKVLSFYIKHPMRAFDKICASADNAYYFNEINEYNFPKGEYSQNKIINNFRYNLINKFPSVHRNIYIFIGFSFVYLLALIIYFFKSKKKETKLLILLLLFLLASGASQLVLPVLGSGFGDFRKHLFLINLSYDILVCSAIIWFINTLYTVFKEK